MAFQDSIDFDKRPASSAERNFDFINVEGDSDEYRVFIAGQDDYNTGSVDNFMSFFAELHNIKDADLSDQTMESPNSTSLILSEIILSEMEKARLLPLRISSSSEGGYCFVFK